MLGCMLVLIGGGCRLVHTTAELPARAVQTVAPKPANGPTVDPEELQQTLMRFADEFSYQMVADIDRLRLATNAIAPTGVLRAKIAFTTEATSIATGPSVFANLFDMVSFVTVTRMSVEQHWMPNVYGEPARPILVSCQQLEREIWQIAEKVLTPDQQSGLREAIEHWHDENPIPETSLGVRTLELASQISSKRGSQSAGSGNVWGLLMLDPFAGMDPAVREIKQTRLFAERAVFWMQKMPTLLRWQAELLNLNATGTPTIQQLVTNSTDISTSVERFVTLAENLPTQVSAEREAILEALEDQQAELATLAAEIRQTLDAGSQMATALNTTLTTFDALMERFGVGNTNAVAAPDTEAEPFRIQDYEETAAQLQATAQDLTALLVTLDQTIGSTNLAALSAQVAPVLDDALEGSRDVVDAAFLKGILLIGIALVAALIYRYISLRMGSPRPKP